MQVSTGIGTVPPAVLRIPADSGVRVSRRLVAAAAALDLWITAPMLWELAQPGAFVVPRFSALVITPVAAGVVIGVWATGVAGLLTKRWAALGGGLVLVATALTILFDRQVTSGHIQLLGIAALCIGLHEGMSRSDVYRLVAGVPLRVYQAQISIVLLWTAVAKLNPTFLGGSVLNAVLRDGIVPFPSDLRVPGVLAPVAVLTVLVEAFIAIGLWSPRLRAPALVLAVGLHLSIILLMPDPLVFTAFALAMAGGYALFAAEPWQEPAVDPRGNWVSQEPAADEKSKR